MDNAVEKHAWIPIVKSQEACGNRLNVKGVSKFHFPHSYAQQYGNM